MRKWAMAVVALAAIPAAVDAYTIGILDPIHERLAMMSEQCLAFGGVRHDTDYGGRLACPFSVESLQASRRSISRWPRKQTPLEGAARWGDDPGRGLSGFGRGADYLWKLEVRCDRLVRRRDDPDRFVSIYQAGVMCSGHYGKLGFFHAMMSIDDAATVTAAARAGGDVAAASAAANDRTRAKIMAWASFTYRVARGELPPGDNFCAAVSAYPDLADAFGDGARCRGDGAAWTIGRFFTFACSNPNVGDDCGIVNGDPGAVIRLAALGSLLHMVQDSYAQGHVRRLDTPIRDQTGKLAPVIACATPRQYHYYDAGNRKDGHGHADGAPDVLGCAAGRVDDPVSVGATILWLLRSGRSSGDLLAYLDDRVLPLRDN